MTQTAYASTSGYSNTITISYPQVTWVSPTPAPAAPSEEEVKRQDFVFPYTGTQVAEAITKKVEELREKHKAVKSVNDRTLEAINGRIAREAAEQKESRLKELRGQIDELQRQERAYRQAAKKKFELDLEDCEFFGL